jgi:sortase (surface protein transpeptidase)
VQAVTPIAIRIPSIKVNDTSFMPVDLDDNGVLQTPPLSAPMTVAYYKGAPMPGEAQECPYPTCPGSATLLAHVNANGAQGAFAKLAQVKNGATIEVGRSDGKTATFTVYRVQVIKKAAFPTAQVYGDTTTPEIRLLTCGPGPLETLADGSRSYVNQTIAYARFTGLKSSP